MRRGRGGEANDRQQQERGKILCRLSPLYLFVRSGGQILRMLIFAQIAIVLLRPAVPTHTHIAHLPPILTSIMATFVLESTHPSIHPSILQDYRCVHRIIDRPNDNFQSSQRGWVRRRVLRVRISKHLPDKSRRDFFLLNVGQARRNAPCS